MSRASVGLASSCLSLKHARFAGLNLGGGLRVRAYAKPRVSCVAYERGEEVDKTRSKKKNVSDFGPSLARGRRLPLLQFETSQQDSNILQETQWARKKAELEFGTQVDGALAESIIRSEYDQRSCNAFIETNLLNAKEVVEKLVKEDGTVKKHLKFAELDRESFTRVFEVAAVRVPADWCGVFVPSLQGHLLNWPRVKNVPRVEGDDGDAALKSLLWKDEQALQTTQGLVESVISAVYPEEPDLDGEQADKIKNKRRLPSLRKLTRGVDSALVQSIKSPKRGLSEQPLVRGREEGAVSVKIVGECQNSQNHDNEPRDAWRLLLLDERYNDTPNDELPQAVQAVLAHPGCELVRCELTLTYDYWPMDEILKEVLPPGMTTPTAFETVGHIAHLNLRNEHIPYRHAIAQIVLEKNKPRIRTVVNKTDVIHNNYWNSRLATERQRLIDTFNENDIVCDMFAGVGPIAIVASKKVKFVYANDLNPAATTYMHHNLRLNKLAYKVEVSNDDARQFVRNLLARNPPVLFTQVVMNLPLDAAEFLDVFVHAFSRDVWERHTLPHIHVYGFSKAKDPEAEYSERIADVLGEMPHPIHIHRVRLVAPGKYMLCASFRLPANVAFPRGSTIREYA
ncbi:tRNA (guanine(37)-N(1))-methyltransferase 1 isoform X2 [Physcomitrium patens]|uniref:tRNA (guanine(37)-N(1))-methyltransferase 1 isoform X2 n=1 Tax=Physcomitrium patens TaxID=3218 RepID=UPI000D161529|nr:tRNA (guanine(37)-N1)-methyltransferase 1-like isoform X2 [Physcomitrium patens]|eukprot:XP_024397999.1 tRNA (guanine(37)-N1)-methyltransferase 1-like isoform X2 [Physcomitrella patens]